MQGQRDTAELWDRRHKQVDDLRSGGHIGYDAGSNGILYAVRLGKLITIIGDLTHSSAPLRVLDAGCGKGWFARAMGPVPSTVESCAHG